MSYCTLNKSDVMEGVSDMLIHLSLSLSASIASLSLAAVISRLTSAHLRSLCLDTYLPSHPPVCPFISSSKYPSIHHPSIITLPNIHPLLPSLPTYHQPTNQPKKTNNIPTIYYPSSSFPPSHQLANQSSNQPAYLSTYKLQLN